MHSCSITPVILSGGSGSRMWPLSRRAYPKQLLPLVGSQTMIRQTLDRVQGGGFAAPVIICNQEHRFLVAEQLREAGINAAAIILEPIGRNTAPATTIAALQIADADPEGLLLLMPSDHIISNKTAFLNAIEIAARAAHDGALVTFGITPSSPETGYGYIKSGAPLNGIPEALHVARFVEKPDRPTAEAYVKSGNYFWNSGMFLFRASAFLAETEQLQPMILSACRDALAHAHRDVDFIRLNEPAFLACPSDSIDYAIMEKAACTIVVPVDMGWSDVGSWEALWNIVTRNSDGNAISGDVIADKSLNSYIRSEGPLVAAVGVEDLVIVATKDAVLVSRRDTSQDVKRIVEQLESRNRDQHIFHSVIHRSWGSYENLDSAPGFRVRRLSVKPGAKLSLQMHNHRAEHWVVVRGTALVTCNDKQLLLGVSESTFIPRGTKHRLENLGNEKLDLIEVQSGSYLGEDDIVRFENSYGRTQTETKSV